MFTDETYSKMKEANIKNVKDGYAFFGEEIQETHEFAKFDFIMAMYIFNVFIFVIVFFSIVIGLIYNVRKQMK